MIGDEVFSPGAWQFYSNPAVRPKRAFEAILLFGDLMFGGRDVNAFPPFVVKSFSRPGYSTLEKSTSTYQLKSGDFAKVDYPTQGFTVKPISVTLLDVNTFGRQGADTAGHINASLAMMQKTWKYEEAVTGMKEGAPNRQYDLFMKGYVMGNPKLITILELDGGGGTLGEWSIYKPILTSVDFSDINYGAAGFGTVSLKFDYKNFKFEQGWSKRELKSRLSAADAEKQQQLQDLFSKSSQWTARTF
jgi:hypothetical protein